MDGLGYLTGAPDVPETDWKAGVLPGTTQNADNGPTTGAVVGAGFGRYGVADGTGGYRGGAVGAVVADVWGWITRPLIGQASAGNVFLMVGVVIVAVLVWNFILYHIRIAGESI